jgi:DNA primase
MEVEGMDFRQALEHLARKAGVDLTMYQSAQSGELARKKKRLLEAHQLAANYFQQSLIKNEHAAKYVFQKRGLSKEIVRDFMIGYAPQSGDALVQFLTKKGFTKKELADAGLTNRFGGDLFRGRMTVPLMDASGQVIGFTARIIEDDPTAPKYLNTPQTLLYDKSRHVFGLSQAKESIRKNDYAVIVEGNLDVVSSHQAGVTQVVATAGTAMTEYHLKALARLTVHIRLAFDGDKAGVAATERAIPIADAAGVELTIVTLPGDAKDPDELIKQDVSLWQRAIDTAEPAVDWLLHQYEQRVDLTTAAGKRQYTTAGLGLVRLLNDPVDQDHYVQLMSRTAGSSVEALRDKLAKTGEKAEQPQLKRVADAAKTTEKIETPHQDLFALLAYDGATRAHLEDFDAKKYLNEAEQAFVAYLQTHPEPRTTVPDELQKYEDYIKIGALQLHADDRYAAWSASERFQEVARLLRLLITEYNKTKREELIVQLSEAEDTHDDERAATLLVELNALIKEIKHG